jgi:hypothetical protein
MHIDALSSNIEGTRFGLGLDLAGLPLVQTQAEVLLEHLPVLTLNV